MRQLFQMIFLFIYNMTNYILAFFDEKVLITFYAGITRSSYNFARP